MKKPYEADPHLVKLFLHVGDTVIYKGQEVIVEDITLIENSTLDGVRVKAAPWMAKELFAVDLTDGRWAYGTDITQKE